MDPNKVGTYGLCSKGYINQNEIFSPVVKQSSLEFHWASAAKFDIKLVQLDAKATFLMID